MRLLPITLLISGYIQSKQHVFNSTSNLVQKLQEYVRFNTVSQDHNYSGVSKWLKSYIEDIGLELRVVKCNEEKPIIIGTWKGEDPSLKSILINSHYDVVPVSREFWDYDPFGGELAEYKGERVIYGRGTQDDKVLTIIQLETLRLLKNANFKPLRTIHITIVPDEEVYGAEGMGCLTKHQIFKELNIGAALDEGGASSVDSFVMYYGERAPWNLFKFIKNLAINKLTKFFNYVDLFRKEEELRSKFIELGKVTTVNLVKLGGGTANNVVPDTLWANYNIRVSPTLGGEKLKKLLEGWAKKSDVSLEYLNAIEPTISPHDDNAHVYSTILSTTKEFGYSIKPLVCPGGTDGRYLRFLDIPSYAFTPCTNVEPRSHGHNEFIPVRCLQTGLLYYSKLLPKLAELKQL
ncbi:Zn-dependent exopeptidase [Conidiobolus coronatus NRRL 28638]|uniref:Zn-dependent exopeptidase n=1 Tax=Conidiobolus coronatus (strain ATCC 28846 / CBS 209.66 / NRRL 28638) TaxID=796925 RepID=A0A137NSR2_CONC2|nr:Zn-dependent exopeptidase [Conidiobolus coronatus NRRL 28638]|eukprot:KXN65813.1 Zn-dependent exopeptidase [Conidiobolus coronatus NRRL 28638]